MCNACAIIGFNSTSPSTFNAAFNAGASSCVIQCRRSSTSRLLAPKRSTLPSPSLKLLKARRPFVLFSITHSGMDGLMMPAIGPTA